MSLGKRLKDARIAAGLTQRQLGDMCQWGKDAQSRIAHYEGGRNEPTIGVIQLIATLLGADPCELAFGPNHRSQPETRILAAYRAADARGRHFIETACASALRANESPSQKRRVGKPKM